MQTTCERKTDRQTDGRRERESKEMGQSLLRAVMAGLEHQGTGMGAQQGGRQHGGRMAGQEDGKAAGQKVVRQHCLAMWAERPGLGCGTDYLLSHSTAPQRESTAQPTAWPEHTAHSTTHGTTPQHGTAHGTIHGTSHKNTSQAPSQHSPPAQHHDTAPWLEAPTRTDSPFLDS